jgi:hypothetical protein
MKPNVHRTLATATLWLAASLLAGCASTEVQTTGAPLAHPLCRPGSPTLSLSVLWAPDWRADQKEPPLREAAALRGIEAYFKAQPCVGTLAIHRIALPPQREQLTDAQVLALAPTEAGGQGPDQLIFLVVRELGPKLTIGIPMVIAGGTEVVLEARATDAHTATSLAHTRTHWQKGGPFYIKGVKTLDQDMQTVLGLLFSAPPAPPAP